MSTVETPADATAPNGDAPTDSASLPEAPSPGVAHRRRFWEWIWRGRALKEAQLVDDAALDRALVRQAIEAVELADRLITRVLVLRSGSGMGSALILYRDALLLSAAAVREEGAVATGGPSDDATRVHRIIERVTVVPDSKASTAQMLLASDSVTIGRLTEEERGAQARWARVLLHEVLDIVNAKQERRARVLAQRISRTGLFVMLLLGLGAGTMILASRLTRPQNLLEHSTHHASSAYPGFSLESGMCDGKQTHLLFHTTQEDNPFVEFDMGKVQHLRHVQIVNRQDCCDERALPLVIETSVDGKRFQEVLRKTTPFKKLDADIRPVSARFLKIRALKKTWLHLERVAAW
jgi:hypothetical protein